MSQCSHIPHKGRNSLFLNCNVQDLFVPNFLICNRAVGTVSWWELAQILHRAFTRGCTSPSEKVFWEKDFATAITAVAFRGKDPEPYQFL